MGEKIAEVAVTTTVSVVVGAIIGTILFGPGPGTAAGAKVAACCCGVA